MKKPIVSRPLSKGSFTNSVLSRWVKVFFLLHGIQYTYHLLTTSLNVIIDFLVIIAEMILPTFKVILPELIANCE